MRPWDTAGNQTDTLLSPNISEELEIKSAISFPKALQQERQEESPATGEAEKTDGNFRGGASPSVSD